MVVRDSEGGACSRPISPCLSAAAPVYIANKLIFWGDTSSGGLAASVVKRVTVAASHQLPRSNPLVKAKRPRESFMSLTRFGFRRRTSPWNLRLNAGYASTQVQPPGVSETFLPQGNHAPMCCRSSRGVRFCFSCGDGCWACHVTLTRIKACPSSISIVHRSDFIRRSERPVYHAQSACSHRWF